MCILILLWNSVKYKKLINFVFGSSNAYKLLKTEKPSSTDLSLSSQGNVVHSKLICWIRIKKIGRFILLFLLSLILTTNLCLCLDFNLPEGIFQKFCNGFSSRFFRKPPDYKGRGDTKHILINSLDSPIYYDASRFLKKQINR